MLSYGYKNTMGAVARLFFSDPPLTPHATLNDTKNQYRMTNWALLSILEKVLYFYLLLCICIQWIPVSFLLLYIRACGGFIFTDQAINLWYENKLESIMPVRAAEGPNKLFIRQIQSSGGPHYTPGTHTIQTLSSKHLSQVFLSDVRRCTPGEYISLIIEIRFPCW